MGRQLNVLNMNKKIEFNATEPESDQRLKFKIKIYIYFNIFDYFQIQFLLSF